jgi:hypothetical protein
MWVGLEWGAWDLNPKLEASITENILDVCGNYFSDAMVLVAVGWGDEGQEEV